MRGRPVWNLTLHANFALSWTRGGAILGVALIPIVIWIGYAVGSRTQVLVAAEANEDRITEIVRQQILRVFEKQAVILDLVAREARDRDCPALRADPGVKDFMVDAMRQSAKTSAVWVLDVNGLMCLSSDAEALDTVSRSFREYFINARTIGFDHYYVNRGIMGLLTRQPIFDIAKPRRKDGAFNGIVLVSVTVESMRSGWAGIIGASSRRIDLFRTDGAVVARSVDAGVLEPNPEMEKRVASFWKDAPKGSVIGRAVMRGVRRVAAWRTLPEWGVVVTSSVDEDDVLQPWRRSTMMLGALAVGISALLSRLVSWLLSRQQRLSRIVEERTRLLTQSSEEFRTLAEGLPALCWMATPDGHTYWYNQRWYDYTGTTSSQMAGWGWAAVHDPAVLPAALERWQTCVATGAPFEMTFPLRRADGTFRPFLTRIAPEVDANGRICRWLGTSIDVTEATEREAALERMTLALREHEKQLENRIITAVHAHEQALIKLAHAEKLTALGRLAGGMAHDFNNVLQSVGGAAELLEAEDCDPQEVQDLAHTIVEAARRGANVSRRLLTFSHQDSLRITDINVSSLLEEICRMLRHTVSARIAIVVDIENDIPPLHADKGQLETMLINLATNARDAMPEGGTLTFAVVRDDLPAVVDSVFHHELPAGKYLRLSVTDTGVGMEARVLARACEPFFTTKDVGKGTGLGLSMARRFVEQSGGQLRIISMPGCGTTIDCWFPVTPSDVPIVARPAAGDARLASAAKRRDRLLMVDDDGFVRKILARQMEAAGYAVLTATAGVEALELLDGGEDIDLLISDFSMPGMDGVALIRAVHERKPLLPAILLTGYTEDAAMMATTGATSGLFTLLQKPISGEALAKRVAIMLDEAAEKLSHPVSPGRHARS